MPDTTKTAVGHMEDRLKSSNESVSNVIALLVGNHSKMDVIMKLCTVILEHNSVSSDLLEFIETDSYVYQSIVESTAKHIPSAFNPEAGTADISEFAGGNLNEDDDALFGMKTSITDTAGTEDMDDLFSSTNKKKTPKSDKKSHRKSSKKKVKEANPDTLSADVDEGVTFMACATAQTSSKRRPDGG